jgi:branched-chain amino acid transport system substrate-binding protein
MVCSAKKKPAAFNKIKETCMNKFKIAALTTLTAFAAIALAQETGVTDTSIKIGTWGPTSGPAQVWGTVMTGIEAYFTKINQTGGIHGRKLELLKRDDGYDPARTKLVVKELIERQNVFALVGGVGTPNGLAILEDVRSNAIPWVSPATGSTAFSQIKDGVPVTPTIFSTYTNYQIESTLLLRHAVNTMKLEKIAVVYINQGFGLEGAAGVDAEINAMKGKATLVAKVPHEPSETSLALQALKVKESNAQAVVLYTADAYAISLLREMAKIGFKPQILASSVLTGTAMFQAGPATQWNGAIAASFLPFPTALLAEGKGDLKADIALLAMSKLAPEATKADPFRMLAGWAFAQPLVEGLRRTGPNLTRADFVKSMETLKNWKGSLFANISYSPTDRQGNNSVFLVKAVYAPKPGFVKVGGWVSFDNRR